MSEVNIDVTEIMKILPHRYPILLVDRVTELALGESIVAYKNISMGESVFQGHFPDYPIFPGVMTVEALAQAGGILAIKSSGDMDLSNKLILFMGIENAVFRRPVTPGDQMFLHVKKVEEKTTRIGVVWKFAGEARVNGKMVATADFTAMVKDND